MEPRPIGATVHVSVAEIASITIVATAAVGCSEVVEDTEKFGKLNYG